MDRGTKGQMDKGTKGQMDKGTKGQRDKGLKTEGIIASRKMMRMGRIVEIISGHHSIKTARLQDRKTARPQDRKPIRG